uniref:8-oxo-dGTP diphosphatase n=1 Tax=Tetradesmus obliquus TaxID=3088 RepID=A0A383V5X9_TETOB|eukprot:jgi/Sobl393_1/10616/SZX61015.1
MPEQQQQQQQQQEQTTSGQQQQVKMVLVVAVALIDSQHRLLLAQRPPGKAMAGLWEFPGGKVDAGETPEAALVRELQEELSIQVEPRDLQPLTFASHTYDSFHLLMPLYVCRKWSGQLRGVEGQQLAWVSPRQLHDYPMPAADVPLVAPVLQAMEAGRTISA